MNDRILLLFVSLLALVEAAIRTTKQDDLQKFTIQMIGYSPQQTDDYVAVSVEAPAGYIVGFEPLANADRVHHMLLYGCTMPANEQGFWKGMQTCGWGGGSYILYAWARNEKSSATCDRRIPIFVLFHHDRAFARTISHASITPSPNLEAVAEHFKSPNLVLPKDVAFSVGHEQDGIKYFVLQVHYAQPFAGEIHDFSGVTLHISQQKPMNLAAVMLFVSGTPIPPQRPAFQNNITCMFESSTPIHPFAFRTHTHAMGRVVSAFFKHDGLWTKIGKRNPQWPQLFEAIPTKLTIASGDQMSASCRFDSMDKNRTVNMGAMGVDEMCNFYMMFHYDAKLDNPYPQGAICSQNSPQLMRDYPHDGFELLPPRPELEHHAHQSAVPFGVVNEAIHESLGGVKLGQVAGLAFDNSGRLLVFHRAGRVWDQSTFDNYNILLDKTPIKEPVILIISYQGNQTKLEKRLGGGLFHLPHGIYVDKDDFLYTTDVGSHTVSKWKIEGNDLKNVWTSGEKMMPGPDEQHFCKPTGITRIGDLLYVTDGYCNSRVVVLDLNGHRVQQFGLPGDELGQFNLPHDIVADSAGRLLVTDRENGRVQHMTVQGHVIENFKSSMFTNIYSAATHEDYVFMVPGRALMGHESEGISVFVGRSGSGLIEFAFGPATRGKREQMGVQFGQPHCIRVSPDGLTIFIGDIAEGKARLWQFKIQHEEMTKGASLSWPRLSQADTGLNSFIILTSIAILALGAYCVKRRCRNLENGGAIFDKRGFKPLRTEETVGFISDGSDSE